MATTDRLTRSVAAEPLVGPVTLLRIAIILAVLAIWEFMAHSGLLYRDVVPSLFAIGRALYDLLSHDDYYFNLGVTAAEIGTALLIGGLSGLAVGILLGANRFLSRAFEPYLYYLGPTPKIIFFPIMIMWFGVGPGSKIALGTLSCFFPVALSVAAGMRQIDKVLIRVGQSFRASTWQMIAKIYLPAMRHPIINGIRLGLGVALINIVGVEFLINYGGLGQLINDLAERYDLAGTYAAICFVILVSVLFFMTLEKAERWLRPID
jgi:ABC-type nitrate/sulfonate/bicarbonate transport system permease component